LIIRTRLRKRPGGSGGRQENLTIACDDRVEVAVLLPNDGLLPRVVDEEGPLRGGQVRLDGRVSEVVVFSLRGIFY
jgi:hypothetical protein